MRRIAVLALGLAMLTMTVPVTAETSTRASNRAFVLDHVEDYDPDEIVEVHLDHGIEEMRAEEALELVLDRAGDRDLAAMADGAQHTNGPLVQTGEVLLYGLGDVRCGDSERHADRPPQFSLSPQGAWLDQGPVQSVTNVSANVWWAWGMTFKDVHQGFGGPLSYSGAIARLCIPNFYGDGLGILFPLIDGTAVRGNVPPVFLGDLPAS
jgi:hypothetical protein